MRADALCAVARRDWPTDQRREIARYRTRRADTAALLVSAGISDERLRRTAAAKRQPLLGGDRAEGGYVGQDAVLPRRTKEPSSGDAGCREHQRDSFTTRYQVPCVRRAQRGRTGSLRRDGGGSDGAFFHNTLRGSAIVVAASRQYRQPDQCDGREEA